LLLLLDVLSFGVLGWFAGVGFSSVVIGLHFNDVKGIDSWPSSLLIDL